MYRTLRCINAVYVFPLKCNRLSTNPVKPLGPTWQFRSLWKNVSPFSCLKYKGNISLQHVLVNPLQNSKLKSYNIVVRSYVSGSLPGKRGLSRKVKYLLIAGAVVVGGFIIFGRPFLKVFVYAFGAISIFFLGILLLAFLNFRNVFAARRMYNEIVSALQIHRKEIEKIIGDFDIPKFTEITWFVSSVKSQNGLTRPSMNYAFGFEGSLGRGVGAAQGIRTVTGTWELVTFKVDLQPKDSMIVTQRTLVQKEIQQTTIDTTSVSDFEGAQKEGPSQSKSTTSSTEEHK